MRADTLVGLTPREELRVDQDVKNDAKVLASRRKGNSFGKIAEQFGLSSSKDALTTYQRAVGRLPAAEQKAVRAEERKRFDAMAKRTRANKDLSKEEIAKRLERIVRLRAAVG